MRFKLDENLPPEAAAFLRDRGHEVATVWGQTLRGRPDVDIAEVCRRESRAFITLDTGFGDIRRYPPEEHPGLIVLRLEKQSRSHVLAVIERVEGLLKSEPLDRCLWVVDEQRVRIRMAPAKEK